MNGLMMAGLSLICQQGNNWYFGFNAGVTFNTNPPTALTVSSMYTNEGCASISDNYGNLLFYTDGITIYNKNHQIMMNGDNLLGDFSATQSALLVQQPGNDSIYYVFTSPAGETALRGGYNYNIININRNAGEGEVILKNQFIFGKATERLTAARDANGKDVWIILKEFNTNKFLSYKLDCSGFNATPVISQVGDPIFSIAGYMRVSNDGNYLAVAMAGTIEPYVNIYKFDNSTGVISQPIHIPVKVATYGLEFSPDSKLLYATNYPDFSGIYQFSLGAYDSVNIASSKLFFDLGKNVAALQTGPDGKIYVSRPSTKLLAAIENPNVYGSGCNFRDSAVILTKECRAGLPNFLANQLVNLNTNISYTVNTDCSTVNFTGATAMQGMVNWLWDFGDGSTSTDQNPVHNFPAFTNQFSVKLTVAPVAGCGNSYTTKVLNLVRPNLTAKFGLVSTCGNLAIAFKDSSVISAGAITNWAWDFGDGNTANIQHPIHSFLNPGTYTVKLSVTYSQGCVVNDAISKSINIETKPVAGFTNGNACINKGVTFIDAALIATGTIDKWQWNFGDGTSSIAQSPSHNFTSAGTFLVQQIVQSNTGCRDTIGKSISVDAKPVAAFTIGKTCINSPAAFVDESTVSTGNITEWYWQLDDGSTDNTQKPLHNFANYGDYNIKLLVKTGQGCLSDTLIRSIRVETNPVADFSVQDGCVNTGLSIQNNSTIVFGTIDKYFWDFGNGETSNIQKPLINYAQYGNYAIKFTAISKNGCVGDTVQKTVNIESIPKPDFNFGNTCAGKPVSFSNLSSTEYGPIINWVWEFGTTDGSALFEPTYTYQRFGDYVISLEAATKNGCKASLSKNISIKKINVFAGNDTIISVNQPLQLYASGAKDYTWSPPQYLNDPASEQPIAVLSQSQTYYLSGLSAEGCTGYDTINIKVYKDINIYVPNAFTPNGDGKNDLLKPILPGISSVEYFLVYNRFGQIVFRTTETNKGWDGKFTGKDQDAGTYVWIIKAKDYNGKTRILKGVSLLIR